MSTDFFFLRCEMLIMLTVIPALAFEGTAERRENTHSIKGAQNSLEDSVQTVNLAFP